MIINYDIQKINSMLLDFYNATGVNMGILGEGFSFVVNKRGWEKTGTAKLFKIPKKVDEPVFVRTPVYLRKAGKVKR